MSEFEIAILLSIRGQWERYDYVFDGFRASGKTLAQMVEGDADFDLDTKKEED